MLSQTTPSLFIILILEREKIMVSNFAQFHSYCHSDEIIVETKLLNKQ